MKKLMLMSLVVISFNVTGCGSISVTRYYMQSEEVSRVREVHKHKTFIKEKIRSYQ